jgi:hypothetical protein
MVSSRVVEAINSAKKYPYIVRVGVFGSYARNEETALSDLDILLEYDDSSDDFLDDLGNFMEDMERLIKVEIGYVTMEGLMKSLSEELKREILRDVQWCYAK